MIIAKTIEFREDNPEDYDFIKEIEFASFVTGRYDTKLSNPRPIWICQHDPATVEDLEFFMATLGELNDELIHLKEGKYHNEGSRAIDRMWNELWEEDIQRYIDRIARLIIRVNEYKKMIE